MKELVFKVGLNILKKKLLTLDLTIEEARDKKKKSRGFFEGNNIFKKPENLSK
jgi:hypothetical protein